MDYHVIHLEARFQVAAETEFVCNSNLRLRLQFNLFLLQSNPQRSPAYPRSPLLRFFFDRVVKILKLFPASTLVLYNLSSSSLFTINASVLNLQISPTVHLQYHLTRLFNLTNSHIP
jgi:hypothetical protein